MGENSKEQPISEDSPEFIANFNYDVVIINFLKVQIYLFLITNKNN